MLPVPVALLAHAGPRRGAYAHACGAVAFGARCTTPGRPWVRTVAGLGAADGEDAAYSRQAAQGWHESRNSCRIGPDPLGGGGWWMQALAAPFVAAGAHVG